MKSLSPFAQPILRISMALVFLYFGFQQIYAPENWTGFVPGFLTGSIITAANVVIFNGVLELTLGIFLLIGLYTRISALILSLHLLAITASIGYTPLGVRDFGLAVATFTLFLQESHKNSFDAFTDSRKV